MATLTLRSVKGSPLTNNEVDANFTALNDELALKLVAATYTAADILTKIKTVDGVGSGLDADLLDGLTSTSTNTISTIVARDSAGSFAANVITANGFTGPLTGAVTGNVTGNVTGTAGGLSTTLALTSGGTGATTASAARTNLGIGTLGTQNANAVAITGGTITTLTSAIAIADGGTGAQNAAAARINLGLQIGADVQAQDGDLTALAALATTGMIVRSATNTAVTRTISNGTGVTVTNGDGVAGNPTIAIGQGVSTADNVRFNSLGIGTAASATAGRIDATSLVVSTVTASGNVQNNSLGVGTAASGTAGEIRATNAITSYYSDERLKENIEEIQDALSKVMSLRGVTYNANQIAESFGYTNKEKQVGVLAGDVERVLPEAVKPAPFDIMLFEGVEMSKSGENYKTVQYEKIVPLLIQAIKELKEEVDRLRGV